jgi:hypothetical protein
MSREPEAIWDSGPMAPRRAPGTIQDGSDPPPAHEEADQKMRGVEQHVERRIRLWVVQQERVRLIDGHRGGINARAAQPPPEPPAPAEALDPDE